MAFSQTPERMAQTAPMLRFTPADEDPVTFLRKVGAAQRMENVLVSGFERLTERKVDPAERSPLFDPADHLQPGEELILSEFTDDQSMADMEQTRQRMKNEDDLRAILADDEGGSEFLAFSIAVLSDPTTYIPVGLVGKAKSAKALVARLTLGSAAGVSIAEAGLQATQVTRTMSQTVAAVLLGGAFGAGLGGAFAGLSKARARVFRGQYKKAVQEVADDITAAGKGELRSSAGAARTPPEIDPADSVLADSKGAAEFMAKLKGLAAPGLVLLASPFAKAREAVLRLVDPGVLTKGQKAGRATGIIPVHTAIKLWNENIRVAARAMTQGYRAHRKGGGTLKRHEFREEVGAWLNKADDAIHPDPAVQKVILAYRRYYREVTDKAVEFGIFEKDVRPKTAPNYHPRVYLRDVIKRHRGVFRARIVQYLKRTIPKDQIEDGMEYGDIAEDIIDTIMGNPAGRIPFVNITRLKRGSTAERTFLIDDLELEGRIGSDEPRGFLDKDATAVFTRFVRTLGADIEIQRSFGTTDPANAIAKDIQVEARQLIAKAKSPKEKTRLQERAEKDIATMRDLVHLIRGTQSAPEDIRYIGAKRILKGARDFNFMRLLGMVVISSLPDPGIIILNEGLGRTFGALFSDAAHGFRGIRMSIEEARLAGTATDMLTGDTLRARFDLGERYVTEGLIERALDEGTHHFANAVLINQWNTLMKGTVSMIVSTRILKTIERIAAGKSVSRFDMQRLARSNLSDDAVKLIAAQSEHWERQGGLVFANTEAWVGQGSAEAKRLFRSALVSDVDNTIITPGPGDAPIWTSTALGKSIFQFKKFSMSANQRILLSSLQRRDMAALSGVMSMIALGMFSQFLRDIATTGEVRDRTTRQWIADAVDRSGTAAMLMEADQLMEKFIAVSPTKLATGEPISRFAARGQFSQALGPTVGLVEDLSKAARSAIDQDFTNADVSKLMRLVPAQNHFALRLMLSKAQRSITQSLGLPEKHQRVSKRRPKRNLP